MELLWLILFFLSKNLYSPLIRCKPKRKNLNTKDTPLCLKVVLRLHEIHLHMCQEHCGKAKMILLTICRLFLCFTENWMNAYRFRVELCEMTYCRKRECENDRV